MSFHDKRRREAYNERAKHNRKERKRRLQAEKDANPGPEYGIRAPSGRITKLTKLVYDKICGLLAEGQTIEVAATLSGVDPSTLWTWIRGGQAEPDGPFGQFASDVAYAREVSHRYLVHKIAIDEDWKAAAWLLKNRFSTLYRDTFAQEISGPNGTPVPMSLQTFSVVLELHQDERVKDDDNAEQQREPEFRIEGAANGSNGGTVHATPSIRSGPAGPS
jgi:hypothetical protein